MPTKKNLTIVIAIIAVLDIALLTGLFISFGWAFALTTLGYSIPSATALLGLSYGVNWLDKRKWTLTYLPPVVALIFEIVITMFNIFPGLSGLVPTMIVLIAVNSSVMALVTIHVLRLVKAKHTK